MYEDWEGIFRKLNNLQRLEMLRRMLDRKFRHPHPRRPLRPVDLILPAMLAQLLLFVHAASLPPAQALFRVAAGNLVISALAMLPSLWQRPVSAHWVH